MQNHVTSLLKMPLYKALKIQPSCTQIHNLSAIKNLIGTKIIILKCY